MFGKPITSVAAILLSTAGVVAALPAAAAQPAPSETDAGHSPYPGALPIQKQHPFSPGSHHGVFPKTMHEREGFGPPRASVRAHPLSDASRNKAQAESIDTDDSLPPPPPSDGPQ